MVPLEFEKVLHVNQPESLQARDENVTGLTIKVRTKGIKLVVFVKRLPIHRQHQLLASHAPQDKRRLPHDDAMA